MKNPNKWELKQIAHNHSSDIVFKDFMNLYEKCTPKPHSFLVIDDTFGSDNPSGFKRNLLERIYDNIVDEKLQYNVNREAAKISALWSGKIYKYKNLTGEEILPSDQRRVTEETKLTYSPLGKVFEEQTKTIEKQGRNQISAITNQNERLMALSNKDNHKDNIKKYLNIKLKKDLLN